MSLIESKIEEFAFKNRNMVLDLEERVKKILVFAREIDSECKDFTSLRNFFHSLESRYPEDSHLLVNKAVACVFVTCKRSVGDSWLVFGKKYTWNLVPWNVQIKAGIILCDEIGENRFIRVRTGEGKTLISLFPIAYHALFGKVHVMTSNNYLAERDRSWIGPVLEKLGITSAFLTADDRDKGSAYDAQVVFGSDKEFAFDFLRDSVRSVNSEAMCRARNYVIVDEADHIMLDELQTPVILSSTVQRFDTDVQTAGNIVRHLIEKQEKYSDGLKVQLGKGDHEYKDCRDYLNLLVQVKYSGFAGDWLQEFYAKNPALGNKADKFEHTFLTENGFQDHVERYLLFVVNEDKKECSLTEKGMALIESTYPEIDGLFLIPDYSKQADSILKSGLSRYQKKYRLKKLQDREYHQLNLLSSIQNALYAQTLLLRDKDYILSENKKIELITASTGRPDPQKKYQMGLTQAVEYKENVRQTQSDVVVTSTTVPALLSNYSRICAMSGTISPNRKEFEKIYSIKSFDIPTFKEPAVKHFQTMLFARKSEKKKALISDILFNHSMGRPVLIGTSSVKESEELYKTLASGSFSGNGEKNPSPKKKGAGIACKILNAKNECEEAEIIAGAGKLNAVTISTNMAGRGVDINVPKENDVIIAQNFANYVVSLLPQTKEIQISVYSRYEFDILMETLTELGLREEFTRTGKVQFRDLFKITLKFRNDKSRKERDKYAGGNGKRRSQRNMNTFQNTDLNSVMRLTFGTGLHVIGGEPGHSGRINTQLRGRTGRQGRTGSSIFYTSLEDEIMKNSDSGALIGEIAVVIPGKRNVKYMSGKILRIPFVRNLIQFLSVYRAQVKSDKDSENAREENLFFGSIVESQRKCISDFRESVIGETMDCETWIYESISIITKKLINDLFKEKFMTPAEFEQFKFSVDSVFNTSLDYLNDRLPALMSDLGHKEQLAKIAEDHLFALFKKRKHCFEENVFRDLTKTRLVSAVDSNWIMQINDLEFSKYSAGLYSYAGTGVREKYVKLAYESFRKTIINMRFDFINSLFHIPLPHEMRTNQQKSKISGEVLELIV